MTSMDGLVNEQAEHFLRIAVELTVGVSDIEALQAAALAEIRDPETELDDAERQEQAELVMSDESGAAALQWLIEPSHVLGLVEHIEAVEPREAMLGVEQTEEPLDETLDDELDELELER
ncbi:hypothetical protein SAMN04489764_2679 [Thermostaphylospora chromogena]|mgnify:CR=1 FL=1|jgi:hypothetical protein|uniref:Uncharacterized protein n=2 Tax=Thermostaphylospora chromogena TaxID=35622 RepID=A0A1H1EY55_9ACTN|nr:hypothetical protein SAMN04489764_2679 [Thermostaphylospora chromogena]